LSTTATVTSGVGTYPITVTLGSNPNYSVTKTNASLTVGQRLITIKADAKSKYCGQLDPPLTYVIQSGTVVNGDNFSGALTRVPGEVAGTPYEIQQGTATLGSNYFITYQPANLTITGVTIDASSSSNPVQWVTGGASATLSAKVTVGISPIAGVLVEFFVDGVSKGTCLTQANGIATKSINGLVSDVYKIEAKAGVSCGTSIAYLPVYDPSGGFVTGGGWINSPAGAYLASPLLTGKANFGFVSKYKKGSNVPEGNTEFQFQAGNLNFTSTGYSAGSLVVAGSQAIYKGVGTINGVAGYSFMISAVDGQVNGGGNIDKFRIKIWNASGPVYDNNMGKDDNSLPTTTLGGGSIVIHDGKSTVAVRPIAEITVTEAQPNLTVKAYPTITSNYFNLVINSDKQEKIKARVTDLSGRTVETLNPVKGQVNRFGQSYINGMYFVEVIQGNERKVIRLVKGK
ncbi:MAG: MBG domain-containing protein, partial [Ferruginibacter sp.]|nr:MBG domain-containing protein [Ferruginibacter sp.]